MTPKIAWYFQQCSIHVSLMQVAHSFPLKRESRKCKFVSTHVVCIHKTKHGAFALFTPVAAGAFPCSSPRKHFCTFGTCALELRKVAAATAAAKQELTVAYIQRLVPSRAVHLHEHDVFDVLWHHSRRLASGDSVVCPCAVWSHSLPFTSVH